MSFEPKIIGFLCNWCSYAGADLAGVSRFQYPPNLRVIRVMCSGRIDPFLVLESLKAGADGVFVGGCHFGDCHYLEGNYNAVNKIATAKKLMEHVGIEPERLRLEWVSASEGERFASVITEFTDEVKALGPSKLGGEAKDLTLLTNLSGAERAALSFRLRSLIGREYNLKKDGNVYGEQIDDAEFEAIVSAAIEDSYVRGVILELTKAEPQSVKQLAAAIGKPTDEILNHIVYLRGNNMVAEAGLEGLTPMYKAEAHAAGGA